MNLTKLPGWPALVLHELTHAAAAAPFAEVSIDLLSTTPNVEMRWSDGAPRLAVRVAHLAPTLLGGVLTALTTLTIGSLASAAVPSNPFHALALGMLVSYNWLLYVWPSETDRRPFTAGVRSGAGE